ncbi:MAG: Nramp family divalent metal transporter [Planctomycetes bacterium]|nr:Nramp family divalent metal transporter [Planctomycetota bacterium]
MAESCNHRNGRNNRRWWRSIGPALITACVVFGPGSLLVSANVGATHRFDLLWLLVLTGILMGAYMSMAARIGVVGGATPCTLIARHLNRPAAIVIGLNLFLICATFQFGNNLALAAAAGALLPKIHPQWVIVAVNALIIVFLFTAKHIYRFIERGMKVMVAVILICFAANLVKAGPDMAKVAGGFVPSVPAELSLAMPKEVDGVIVDPMLLIVSLIGTTFAVVAAFYQGNLVREKGWGVREYRQGIGDSITGVVVLTAVSAIIMITTATVIAPGQTADDIGMLAESLRPLLGSMAFVMFCVGLVAVSMNPFLINAMIGGGILADGLGAPARMSDKWPRCLTVLVLLIGMTVAILALRTGQKPIKLIIMGQALTVLGNPLMAVAILWLANQKSVMGSYRNRIATNIIGGLGLVIVVYMAVRVLFLIILKLT